MKMTVVQTTLEPTEMQELEIACKKEGLSKRQAIRLAIMSWVRERKGIDPDDPLFTMAPGSAVVEKAARDVDEVVYGERARGS